MPSFAATADQITIEQLRARGSVKWTRGGPGVIGAFVAEMVHGASTVGVQATTAAYRDGGPWLADVVDYLDGSRRLLADLLRDQLPDVRYRPPEGTSSAGSTAASCSPRQPRARSARPSSSWPRRRSSSTTARTAATPAGATSG
jgi:hypothetical protein